MKKFTIKIPLIIVLAFTILQVQAQKKQKAKSNFSFEYNETNRVFQEESGYIKCATVEYNEALRQQYPEIGTPEQFESWMTGKIQELRTQRLADPNNTTVIYSIPVVIHIIHNGDAVGSDENISDAQAISQITVMNEDYRRMVGTRGYNDHADGADVEIEFCLAQQDPDGNPTNGIDRQDLGQASWSTSAINSTVKPTTIWDPTKYMNMWTVNFSNSILLGYAQFPNNSGLSGLDANNGGADTDGVVANYNAFGSIDHDTNGDFNMNPTYKYGRTMTHEVGHFLGLRHTWGDNWSSGPPPDPDDKSCNVDDYCDDTPNSGRPQFGCPTGADTCTEPGVDMIENYMDYTDDQCMNIFTQDQKDRMVIVMQNSPRRVELASSDVCQPAETFDLDGSIDIDNLNLDNCNGFYAPDLVITNKGNNTLTSATVSYYLDSDTPVNYNWTGSLSIDQSETISISSMSVTTASHIFYAELTNPNGGTDEQLSNNTDSISFEITGTVCTSVANTDYATSTTGVVFNTISNLDTGKPSGYSDYTSLSTDILVDTSYDLSVYANSDGNYQIITYAWIDWNQNCSFEDAGEQYDLGTSADIANELTINSPLTINVPADAVLGSTIMRITTKYTDPDENQYPSPCENNHDAEVEDYTVNVSDPLGVNDYSFTSFSIYPNPSDGLFNLSLQSNNNESLMVQLFDMRGRLVKHNILSLSSTTINTTIDYSSIETGIYLLKVSKGDQIGVQQIIIK